MATKITTWACRFCLKPYPQKQHAINCENICLQRGRARFVSSMADKLFPVAHKKDHIGFTYCVQCGILLEDDDGFTVFRGKRCVPCREELLRKLPKLLENPDVKDVVVFLLRKQR